MVRLSVNRPEYFNDTADELRLFLGHENEVLEVPWGQEADARVRLSAENGMWRAKAEICLNGRRAE